MDNAETVRLGLLAVSECKGEGTQASNLKFETFPHTTVQSSVSRMKLSNTVVVSSKLTRPDWIVPAGLSDSMYSKAVPMVSMSFFKVNVETKEDAPVQEEGAEGVRIKWLLDKSVGAPTFAMRHFIVRPGGHTPLHKHDWEHEVYVLEGEGFVKHQDQEYSIRPGDAIFVPPNQLHQFRSTESSDLRFLCMIPL